MNGVDINDISESDWERIDAMTDEQIDTSDIRPLDDDFFAKGQLRLHKDKASLELQGQPKNLLQKKSTRASCSRAFFSLASSLLANGQLVAGL